MPPKLGTGPVESGPDLHATSQLCSWLALILGGGAAPEAATMPEVSSPPALAAVARRLRALDAGRDPRPGDARTVERETERVRLMVNAPGGIALPPQGSWWLEGRIEGESTRRVAEFYRQDGLTPARGAGPADSLPSELEFLHFLLQHQHAARTTDQPELAAQTRARERDFLERFVLPWVPAFCARGREVTADPFWLALFDLLEQLVRSESLRPI